MEPQMYGKVLFLKKEMVAFRFKEFLFQNLLYILKIVTDYGLMKRDTVAMKQIFLGGEYEKGEV